MLVYHEMTTVWMLISVIKVLELVYSDARQGGWCLSRGEAEMLRKVC
jgi:hypothetical protein